MLEEIKDIKYVYDEYITGVRHNEKGYIFVQLGKGKHYIDLYHGYASKKYVIFVVKDGYNYFLMNKNDILKVKNHIESMKIKEEN